MTKMEKELNLAAIANQAMLDEGFIPEFPKAVEAELQSINAHEPAGRDLRQLLWSSIDDGKTRDLDQVEYAESVGQDEIRVLIGIADVDAFVCKQSGTDAHAFANCTSVYAGVKTFPMLPEKLSTDLTSLVANQDRLAVVTEILVGPDGAVSNSVSTAPRSETRPSFPITRLAPGLTESLVHPSPLPQSRVSRSRFVSRQRRPNV
jgi:exoribonuclease R